MLFTGAVIIDDRVGTDASGDLAVDHVVAGFGFSVEDRLVTEGTEAPQNFIKGIGIRNGGAVCTTTSTAGSDTFIEGVRVSAAGKVVVEDGGTVDHTTSGNPCAANGRLAVAVAVSMLLGLFMVTEGGDSITTEGGDEIEIVA